MNYSNEYDKPIFITGHARGGTSLVAGCVAMCDVSGGLGVRGPSPWNRKGHFESEPLIALNKRILTDNGFDPLGQHPLPAGELRLRFNLRRAAESVMPNERWFFKDAKTCLVHQFWRNAYPEAKWLVVMRSKAQVLASCERCGFMHKAPDWEVWYWHYYRQLAGIIQRPNSMIVVPDDLVKHGAIAFKQYCQWLDIPYNKEKLNTFIEKGLFHGA